MTTKSDLINIGGVLSLLIGIVSGIGMMTLSSISGNTVAEAYYNGMGLFVIAMSLFMFLISIGIAGILVTVEKNVMKKVQNQDRHCPNCGRGIPFESKMCPYCSKDFTELLKEDKK